MFYGIQIISFDVIEWTDRSGIDWNRQEYIGIDQDGLEETDSHWSRLG